MLTKETGLVNS